MKILLIILFAIAVYIIILKVTASYREKRRIKKYKDLLPVIKEMLSRFQYQAVLDRINKESVLKWEYMLPPDLRREITQIKVECFERLGKLEEAVIDLAAHLASNYEVKQWPNDLYEKWISLYKSIEPLPIEKFYFCECCGLHPDTKPLLDYAIEKGCRAPVGYPGQCKSAIAIHFGKKRVKK